MTESEAIGFVQGKLDCRKNCIGLKGDNIMEITRIATVMLTNISKVKNESDILGKDEAKKRITDAMRQRFDIDDVEILDIQDFIRD